MELIEYWYLLLRRKWIIFFCLVLFTALGVTYALLAVPVYQADGKLLFVDDNGLAGMDGLGGAGDMMLSAIGKKADPLMTQIEMMKTRPVLKATIDSLKLTDDLGEPISTGSLNGMLSFSVITNTNIIKMTCKNSDPLLAADILNTLAPIYMDINRGINRESATAARTFIEEQLVAQKERLDETSNALAAYKSEIGTVSLEQETQLKITGISQLESELIRVSAQLQGMGLEVAAYQDKIDEPGARNSSRYTQWRSELEIAKRSYATIEVQRNSIRQRIASENRELNLLPAQEIRFANLLRDSEIAKSIYASLLESFEQFRTREAANVSNIKIVEAAILPIDPIEPQKKKIVMLAVIAGFMVGFGIALLLEYLDDSPRSLEEIKKVLPYNSLGAIPYFTKLSQFYAKENSESFAAESMRLVHTNMKFTGLLDQEHTSIMLTSSQPGEGKTTTSVNLAYTYALLGSKVAIVNLDLRRPSFHKIIDIKTTKGVTDYLIGDATEDEIKYGLDDNLTIIPAGSVPPNPTALIGNERMMTLIDTLNEQFDIVIYDTPPVTLVAETLDIARHMNGVILVADIADSSMKSIKAMATLLEGKELPILGTVMNKMGKGNSSYYGSYNKNGYSAYHQS